MRDCEQGCAERFSERCGWSSIAADLGIVVIAAITLTMAAANHQERTRHQSEQAGDYTAWQDRQAIYHISSPAPVPLPTGWSNEARPDAKPVVDMQWDCELLIDSDADAWKVRKTPTSRAIPQDNRSYLRVYRPGIDQYGIVLCGHLVDRGRRRMDAAK